MVKSFPLKWTFPIPNRLGVALIISQVLAVGWWIAAMLLRGSPIPIWYDQSVTFMQVPLNLQNPYYVYFVNPPWTAVLLLPFAILPLPVAILLQLCLYFAILTAVIYKFGGDIKIVVLALTSFIAFDSALELNIDWLTCLGLLVPAALSGPFLLIKPQNALGVWLSFKRRDLVRAIIVSLIVVLISFVLWGNWLVPLATYAATQMRREYNIAPMALITPPVSIAIGLILSWIAFKRRDPVLSILAWLFFVPYLKVYSLLIPLAMLGIRFPRVAWIVTIALWIIDGGFILRAVLHI